MKKEELTALGLSEEQIKGVQTLNGKDITHAQEVKDAEIAKLTTERDNLQTQMNTANDTLKGFGGKTPEQIQQEIADYQNKAQEAQKDFDAKILARDQRDWLKARFGTGEGQYDVTSEYAKSAIISEVMGKDGLPWKDGAFVGFDDHMKKAKEKDKTLYRTAEEKAAQEKGDKQQEGAPYFTGPAGNGGKKGEKYVPPKIF